MLITRYGDLKIKEEGTKVTLTMPGWVYVEDPVTQERRDMLRMAAQDFHPREPHWAIAYAIKRASSLDTLVFLESWNEGEWDADYCAWLKECFVVSVS